MKKLNRSFIDRLKAGLLACVKTWSKPSRCDRGFKFGISLAFSWDLWIRFYPSTTMDSLRMRSKRDSSASLRWPGCLDPRRYREPNLVEKIVLLTYFRALLKQVKPCVLLAKMPFMVVTYNSMKRPPLAWQSHGVWPVDTRRE